MYHFLSKVGVLAILSVPNDIQIRFVARRGEETLVTEKIYDLY